MGKTIAQALVEEGKADAKQEYLIKLLRGRFDSFPQTLIGKIKSIHRVEQLDSLFDLVLTAETVDEVETGLAEISTES